MNAPPIQPDRKMPLFFPPIDGLRLLALAAGLTLVLVGPARADGGSPAGATPSPVIDWVKTSEAKGYAAARAHAPRFGDRQVWPGLRGDEPFVGQSWDRGKLYVWARPGRSAGGRRATRSAFDAANWIDARTGEPLRTFELGAAVDVYLPPAAERYTVNMRRPGGGEHQPLTVRHLTVDRNAGWNSAGLTVCGNLWVKHGGRFGNHGSLTFAGPGCGFARNDHAMPEGEGRTWMEGRRPPETRHVHVAQYMTAAKTGASSLTLLGWFAVTDEFRIFDCTYVVGPDTWVQPGRNAHPVMRNSTLRLMDGATFAGWSNNFGSPSLEARDSRILAGSPDRPLTRDARLLLHPKNYTRSRPPRGDENVRHVPGLLLEGDCVLASYPAEGTDARLIVTRAPVDYVSNIMEEVGDKPDMKRWYLSLPQKIELLAKGPLKVRGARFDYFRRGGIQLARPSDARAWQHVDFGPHNETPADELITGLED